MNTFYKCRNIKEYGITLRYLHNLGYNYIIHKSIEEGSEYFNYDFRNGYAIIHLSDGRIYRGNDEDLPKAVICPLLQDLKKPSIFRSN